MDGVPFPDLARFGWQARAAREDRVGGRRTMTLVYDRRGRRMTYTIVAGTDNLDDTHPIRVSYDRSGTELNVSLGYSTRWVARFARRDRPVVVTHPVGNDGGGDPSGIRRVLSWSTSLDAR